MKHIMIVDDNEDILLILEQTIMDTFGHRVMLYKFTDTASALEELSYVEGDVDLVVTDYNVPPRNGVEFAKEAKKLTEAPIILFSGEDIIAEKDLEELFAFSIHKSNLRLLLDKMSKLLKI